MTQIIIAFLCAVVVLPCVYPAVAEDKCSTAITIDNKQYAKEVLATNITEAPYDVSIRDATGDIYFAQIIRDDAPHTEIYVVKRGSTKPEKVKGIKGSGLSTAVDNANDVVYVATDSGIYAYDQKTKEAKPFAMDGSIIGHVYHANGALYSSVGLELELIKITKNGSREHFDADFVIGNYLVVDKNENFYFVGETNYAYVAPANYSERIRFLGISDSTSTAFAVDRDDKVFLSAGDKIYRLEPHEVIPQYVGSVDFHISSFAFDSTNNIVFGKNGEIVRYNKVDCKI